MARKQITELSTATQMFSDDLLYKREGAIDKGVTWDVIRKSAITKSTLTHDFGTISAGDMAVVDLGVTLSDPSDFVSAVALDVPAGIITSLRVTTSPSLTAYLVLYNTTASPVVVGSTDVVAYY